MQNNIPFGRPLLTKREKDLVAEVLESPILTHGPMCKQFEQMFEDFTGASKAVSTSSCMMALHAAAINLGFGPGDEVIVPAMTHVATVHAVMLTGATPVFVDCQITDGNMAPHDIAQAVTPNTKGIVVVHYIANPVNMPEVMAIAETHDLKVIEDCALAVGTTIEGKHVGLWGDVGCFSFYPAKHITTAEGGMLISKHEGLATQIAHFRAFGVTRPHQERKIPGTYDVTAIGLNGRMSELQAAIGIGQLEQFPHFMEQRISNYAMLKPKLAQFTAIESRLSNVHYAPYCFVGILPDINLSTRNEILSELTQSGIGCSVYYPHPIPRLKIYQEKFPGLANKYPNAACISDNAIALPIGPHLSEQDITVIGKTVSKIVSNVLEPAL